jgi:phosphoglycerate transport regulatory protein PgtC
MRRYAVGTAVATLTAVLERLFRSSSENLGMYLFRLLILVAALSATDAEHVRAEERRQVVRVLTSFPATLFEPFREEFEKQNPALQVDILQRKTTAALSSMSVSRTLQADVFWASAPDAFEFLKAAGRLARTQPRHTGAPDVVAGYPVNDPDNMYLGFAVSGYGLVYNPRYLAEHGLPIPGAWEDLSQPAYAGHVGISSPSRSGTTHVVVEAILQARGWQRGWALWSAIGGNLATVTARSFGVTAGVARARFGIGISIDFLGRSHGTAADSVVFTLPKNAVFAPASIAIMADAANSEGAERFVDFVFSPSGQALLLRPDIARIPISPAARTSVLTAFDNGHGLRLSGPGHFDAALSARRYEAVNILFDEMITLRRAQHVALWRRIHAAERLLPHGSSSEARDAIQRARDALESPPVAEIELNDAGLLRAIVRVPRGLPMTERQARWEKGLRDTLERNAALAATELARAEKVLSETIDGSRQEYAQ